MFGILGIELSWKIPLKCVETTFGKGEQYISLLL